MTCSDAGPLLHALLDGELDAAGARNVDRHLAECRDCASQYAALCALKQEIASARAAYALPEKLERKLAARFTPRKTWLAAFWKQGAAALAGAAVCAAALAIFPALTHRVDAPGATAAEVLDGHLRALQAGRLFDVQSSDQHTVKPWFQGRTDFSPPVPDLTNDGFALVGGRLEVIHQQTAAAIVYRRRQHVISLYVMPGGRADTAPESREIGGYHLLRWERGGLSYWAVSDVAMADLRDFAGLVAQAR